MKNASYWRSKARPIIAKLLDENQGAPDDQIRKALRNAYPFGPRAYHPYKIWLDEIAVQRGRKRKIFGTRKKTKTTDPNQMKLL